MHAGCQGFASGDCERDGQAIRIFQDDGHEMACSQSYAKNMGEATCLQCGLLLILCGGPECASLPPGQPAAIRPSWGKMQQGGVGLEPRLCSSVVLVVSSFFLLGTACPVQPQ